MFDLVPFCSYVFSPFNIAITSLGEERANLSAFCTFVRFMLVWICRFPLPLGRAAVCDCGTPCSYIFLYSYMRLKSYRSCLKAKFACVKKTPPSDHITVREICR